MGVTHRWYDADKTILLHTYDGDWTMDDFYRIVDDTYTLITSVTHAVDVVIDMSRQGRAPNLMSGLSYAQRKNAPNVGTSYLIKPGLMMSTILRVAERIAPSYTQQIQLVENLDDALKRIYARRSVSR